MARTTSQIKDSITAEYISKPEIIEKYSLLPGLTFNDQFSLVSFDNIMFSIIAFALSIHEKIVETNAENSRPHNIAWYKEKAMEFMDGLDLVWVNGFFAYDLTNVDDAEQRQIIDRCAVLESDSGELVFKVAKDNAGTIEPLSEAELLRFKSYMGLIKDAGNQLRIINQPADLLRVSLTVYVNVQIIDLVTGRLLNTAEEIYPVQDAIDLYLQNLDFNGRFVKSFFQDAVQSATGVELPLVDSVEWKYADFPFATIGEFKIPEAGYFKILEQNLTINYLPYDVEYN